MSRAPHTLALAVGLFAGRLGAQVTDYVPTYKLPEGREILAVYIGSTTCGPCMLPEVKAAVRDMKPLLAAQAKRQNASFAVMGVANDWEVSKGLEFLQPLGVFDQVVVGGNWTNLAIERFIWRDPNGSAAMPQILVLERTVTPGARITFSDTRLLRRISGGRDIPAWVSAGATMASSDSGRQEKRDR